MEDILIFPTSIEQVGTGELVHDNFPVATWTNILDDEHAYISEIKLDIAPVVFFEWAIQTPAGQGPILFYCVNLSMRLLLEPESWMQDVLHRLKVQPKQLTDGQS